MIVCHNISKHYPNGFQALKDVSFEIQKGELVFLTGHSGAGKSTLLKLLAALEKPSSGHIWIGKRRVEQLKSDDIPFFRRHIGLILQNPMLLPDHTLFDNVALPLVIQDIPVSDTRKRVEAALAKVGLLAMADRLPQHLSAGEQQRAGIARAIVHRPPLLLADEPTGNLDPALAKEVMHLFEQFLKIGVTILVVSHDEALIQSMPHRILKLHGGRLVQEESRSHFVTEEMEEYYAEV